MKNNVEYWNHRSLNYDSRLKRSQRAYEKIIELIIKEVDQETHLLDIGTGTGVIPLHLSAHVHKIDAVDPSPEMIKIAENKAMQAGITNIAFRINEKANSIPNEPLFDVITIVNVLHIVPNPGEILENAKRRLKKNGKIIVATFLHNENVRSRVISYIMKKKSHPITSKFTSTSLCHVLEKSSLKILYKEKISNIMPMLYVVTSK